MKKYLKCKSNQLRFLILFQQIFFQLCRSSFLKYGLKNIFEYLKSCKGETVY